MRLSCHHCDAERPWAEVEWQCPECGTHAPLAKTCAHCGRRIELTAARCLHGFADQPPPGATDPRPLPAANLSRNEYADAIAYADRVLEKYPTLDTAWLAKGYAPLGNEERCADMSAAHCPVISPRPARECCSQYPAEPGRPSPTAPQSLRPERAAARGATPCTATDPRSASWLTVRTPPGTTPYLLGAVARQRIDLCFGDVVQPDRETCAVFAVVATR